MKNNLLSIITTVACILCAICLVQISELKQQVNNLQNSLNHTMDSTQRNLSNIYSNIDSKLEEQANLLASSESALDKIDIDAKQVTLKYMVSPKEYQLGVTEAALFCNNIEYPMTLVNGEYTAELPIPLFEESIVSKVQFKENNIIRTQSLEWHVSPRYDFLPIVFANFSGRGHSTSKDNHTVWSRNGQVEINVERKGGTTDVRSITMLEYIDGKETSRTDVPLNTTPSPQSNGTSYMESAAIVQTSDSYQPNYYYTLDREFEIPFGSTLDLYIEVVDSYDLRYRVLIDHIKVSDNGQREEDEHRYWHSSEASIYDSNGNALFELDY